MHTDTATAHPSLQIYDVFTLTLPKSTTAGGARTERVRQSRWRWQEALPARRYRSSPRQRWRGLCGQTRRLIDAQADTQAHRHVLHTQAYPLVFCETHLAHFKTLTVKFLDLGVRTKPDDHVYAALATIFTCRHEAVSHVFTALATICTCRGCVPYPRAVLFVVDSHAPVCVRVVCTCVCALGMRLRTWLDYMGIAPAKNKPKINQKYTKPQKRCKSAMQCTCACACACGGHETIGYGVRVAGPGSHPPRMQHRVDGSYQSRIHTE